MVVKCEDVWREISNYLDGELEAGLRASMEEHFRICKHCTAVLNGTRNVIQVYGDERMFELPAGFSQRLHAKLAKNMPRQKRATLGWTLAFAAAVLIAGSFELGKSASAGRPEIRSQLALPDGGVPGDMVVVVSTKGKTFHVPGCGVIHHKESLRTMTAAEAVREGYAPCVRCLRKYLRSSLAVNQLPREVEAD